MAAPRFAAGAAATLALWSAAVLAEGNEDAFDPDAVQANFSELIVDLEAEAPSCMSSPSFEDELGRSCAAFDEGLEPCPEGGSDAATEAPTAASECCACGGGDGRGVRIVGGYEADPVTSMAICLAKDASGSRRFAGCGAILISPEWVATAAHCTKGTVRCTGGIYANAYNPFQGNLDLPFHFSELKFQVEHPNFRDSTNANDITLMRIREAAPDDWPAIVATEWFVEALIEEEALLKACGFGRTSYTATGPTTEQLLCVEVPIRTPEYCASRSRSFDDGMVCAGWPEGGRDSCKGDSGGPLYWVDDQDRHVLVGIVSYGSGCANADSPGYYANVAKHIEWAETSGVTGMRTTKDLGIIPPGKTQPEAPVVATTTSPPTTTEPLPEELITGDDMIEILEAHRLLRCFHGTYRPLMWSDALALKAKEQLDISSAKREETLTRGCSGSSKASSSLAGGRGGSRRKKDRCLALPPQVYYYGFQDAGSDLFDAHWTSSTGVPWMEMWAYYYANAIKIGTKFFGRGNPFAPKSFADFQGVLNSFDALGFRFSYWREVVVALAESTSEIGCAEDMFGRVCVYRTSNLWDGVVNAVLPYDPSADCGDERSDGEEDLNLTSPVEAAWGMGATPELDLLGDFWRLEANCTWAYNLPEESEGADTSDCTLPMSMGESCLVTCREMSHRNMTYHCVNGFFVSELGPHLECSEDEDEDYLDDAPPMGGRDDGIGGSVDAGSDLDLYSAGRGLGPLTGGALSLAAASFVVSLVVSAGAA